MDFSGIDLHKDNAFIATIDAAGQVIAQRRVPCETHDDPDHEQFQQQFVHGLPPPGT